MPSNTASVSRIIALLSLTVSLQACGGGGSYSPGIPGTQGGSVTAVSRQAAFDSITRLYSGMTHLDRNSENTQLSAAMAGMPVFEATGVSNDSCAWGRFKDGRLLIIANNHTIDTSASKAAAARAVAHTRAAGTGLPQSTTVRIIQAMGSLFSNNCPTIQGWLTTNGYQVANGGVEAGTVAELKAVSGDGIFYMDSHGGSGYLRGTGADHSDKQCFSIFTCTRAFGLDEPAYKADLDSQNLVYMIADYNAGPGGIGRTTENHYAITPTFVSQYMKFGPNSLVFFDACSSDNVGFKAACIAAGAGLYLGWTQPTDDGWAAPSTLFLFDRLVGANTQQPVAATPLPPMDWGTLQSTMASTIRPSSATYTYVTMPHIPNKPETNYTDPFLTFTPGNGDLGTVLPAITAAAKDPARQTLTLTGSFGSKPGTVLVTVTGSMAQTSAAVITWSSQSIVATLPANCTSAQVVVDGRPSNRFDTSADVAIVQLTPSSAAPFAGESAGFSVSVSGQDPSALLTYHWSTTTNAGAISDGPQTGASFDSTKAAITYTASGTAQVGAVDTITLLVYNGGVNNPNRQYLGMATATVTIADVAIGTIKLTISNMTFDTSQLTNGTGPRLIPEIFARFEIPASNNWQLNSDHSMGADNDTINTNFLNFGSGYYVGQVLDLSSSLNINQILLDLFTPAGGDYAMANKSGTLTVTATGVDPLTGGYYFKFRANVHFSDNSGATALDAVMVGSFSNLTSVQ